MLGCNPELHIGNESSHLISLGHAYFPTSLIQPIILLFAGYNGLWVF